MTADDLPAAFASLPSAWRAVLPADTSEKLAEIGHCIERVSGSRPIAPADPFRALRSLAPDEVRVVVVGQDPYPTAGHADGLAFSAGQGKPRSLARVFEVLAQDRPGFVPPAVWALDEWARRGVLLLNPVLTVEVGKTASHVACGWQALTGSIVASLAARASPPAFLLWGEKAKTFWKASLSAPTSASVFMTRHPSYDFDRRFMADGSHFEATADLVDWWAIGRKRTAVI